MPWLPFVLFIVAGILFLLDFWRPQLGRLQSLGLAFLVAGLIFFYTIHTSSGLIIIH